MEKENNKIFELMNRRPFRVPEGYFEGFTDDLMSRLPEKSVPETNKISLYTYIKPLLYMAAMFVGAMVFLSIINYMKVGSPEGENDVTIQTGSLSSDASSDLSEDAEFMEYIEEMYVDKYAISYTDDFIDNW